MKQNFIFMGAVTLLLGTAVATKAQIVIPAPTYQYTFDGGDASQSVIEWDGSTAIDNLSSTFPLNDPIKKYSNEFSDRASDIKFIHDDNLFLNKTDAKSRYLRLDGTNSVEATDSAIDFSKYKSLTLSYWFFRASISPRYDNTVAFIRDAGQGVLSNIWANTNEVNTQVNFVKVGEDATKASAATNLLRIQAKFTTGAWHLYTVVYDMTGTAPKVTVYLDGTFVKEATDETLTCNMPVTADKVHIRFGNNMKTSNTSYQSAHPDGYNVDIDNFCLWKDVALNDDQVEELYNKQLKDQIFATGMKNIVKTSDHDDVYSIQGVKVRTHVNSGNALDGLGKGVYIINGKKIMK
jgi:hypothetical protein